MSKTKVVTGKVRLSYVNLFEPRAAEEGKDPKYSVCLLIPKSDKATVAAVRAAIATAAEAAKAQNNGKIPANLKSPLRDGDVERDSEEYRDHWFINATSKLRPGVVDAGMQRIIDPTEVYSGCYGRAAVNFYYYSVNGNRGVAAGLQNVQKLEDGEPLGGRSRAEDDFSTSTSEDFLS